MSPNGKYLAVAEESLFAEGPERYNNQWSMELHFCNWICRFGQDLGLRSGSLKAEKYRQIFIHHALSITGPNSIVQPKTMRAVFYKQEVLEVIGCSPEPWSQHHQVCVGSHEGTEGLQDLANVYRRPVVSAPTCLDQSSTSLKTGVKFTKDAVWRGGNLSVCLTWTYLLSINFANWSKFLFYSIFSYLPHMHQTTFPFCLVSMFASHPI